MTHARLEAIRDLAHSGGLSPHTGAELIREVDRLRASAVKCNTHSRELCDCNGCGSHCDGERHEEPSDEWKHS